MQPSQVINIVTVLLIGVRPAIFCCRPRPNNNCETTAVPLTTPLITTPIPVSSSCGHTMYYNTDNVTDDAGIVGGHEAKENQYPWIVRLEMPYDRFCGGTIIDESWVITAAHCIMGRRAKDIVGVFAEHDSSKNDTYEFRATFSEIILNMKYNHATSDYDVALLHLKTPLSFEHWSVQKICLPESCSDECNTAGTPTYISGWGSNSYYGEFQDRLQTARVEIASTELCQEQFTEKEITEQMICAGFVQGGVDTCQGDSGGPMVSVTSGFYKLCGVTSFGNGCGDSNSFGVYVRICAIRSWIDLYVNGS